VAGSVLDVTFGRNDHAFEMTDADPRRLMHRTATVRLRLTRRQARRCYGLLRSAGDVWAWLLESNRQRHQEGQRPVTGYQALCRELTRIGTFGELSKVGARSVLRRYADAWFEAAKRRRAGLSASLPRRKRALVPVRYHHGTFTIQGQRVRLPVARSQPELWVRLTRPLPYQPDQVRAVTLLADGGRLWLAVTAVVPVQHHDLDPGRVAGVDLGIIHPYAVVTEHAGLLVSGRALRAENYLHLIDQRARRAKAARRAPRVGSAGRGVGATIGLGCGGSRRGIAAASIKRTIRRPSGSSPSPSSTKSAPLSWVIPKASPPRMLAWCRISGYGSGAALILRRPW
jgi:hypothetical protein